MNSIFSVVFPLFLLYQHVSGDEAFFKKSVFRKLENEHGQFSSEIECILPIANRTMSIKENYSFKLNTGWVNRTQSYDEPILDGEPLPVIIIYSNSSSNASLLYQYFSTKRLRYCGSFVYRKSYLKYHLSDWAPSIVFSSNLNFTILGRFEVDVRILRIRQVHRPQSNNLLIQKDHSTFQVRTR